VAVRGDGSAESPAPPSLTVVHAAGSGDDAIVAAAAASEPPVLVFTSDRELRGRLTAAGARVRGSGALWALLDGVPPPTDPEPPQDAFSGF
jgi:hypothetical protein